jgi:tetratricopeptide (TPR) repeat protein
MKIVLTLLAAVFALLLSCTPSKPASPTYARDIAPILHRECVPCHRPGELAPFPLLTYDDARKRARQIVQVTGSGFMPPWKPEPGFGTFVGERRLSAGDIETLRRWAEAEAPLGDSTLVPEPPVFTDGWRLGEPDLVLGMPESYTVPAEGVDLFRNFLLAGVIDETRYIRAFQFRPGNPKVVHHAVIMIDQSGTARRRDALDAEPGFAGMSFGEAREPDGHFLGWTPGKAPAQSRDEMAWSLRPGSDLVVLLHMLPTGKPEPIQASLGLYFAAGPPARVPASIRLGRKDIDIAAGDDNYVLEDRYVLPVDVELLRIYPHMHYLGKSVQVYATKPDGSKQWLIRIDDWDFNWQDDYQYEESPRLPAGTEIYMRYVFDNSWANVFNPNIPPKAVTYGLRSADEMGDLILQVLPEDPKDLAPLLQDLHHQWLAQEIQGHQMLLRADPEDFENHHTIAMYHLQAGSADSADVHFERTLQLHPTYAEAHVNYAAALAARGRLAAGIDHLEQAIDSRPGFSKAHFNLGLALHAAGQRVKAGQHFEEAARLRPEMAAAIRRTVAGLRR